MLYLQGFWALSVLAVLLEGPGGGHFEAILPPGRTVAA